MNESTIGINHEANKKNPELLFSQAKEDLITFLQNRGDDLILCLGDSVEELAEHLKLAGFSVNHLNHQDGIHLYERGSLEEQAIRLDKLIENKKVIVVEDTVLSGGKIWQLKMVFDYLGIPFKAVVLAADPNQKEDYLDIISTDLSLVSFIQKKVVNSMDSRINN